MDINRALRRGVPALAAALTVLVGATRSDAADDVSSTRNVSGFDKVSVNGAFTVDLTSGASSTKVVVTGSSDVVDRVTTEVKDHTLVVGLRSGTNFFSHSPHVTISMPKLRAFSNSGAGKATISGLDGGDFAIENNGVASISAAGRADGLTVTLAGAGKVDTTGLDARDATVDNDGVGSVRVRARGNLTATVNGVGEIRYAGNPAHVQSQVNGVGRISAL
jgi:hypothetical protein